MVRPALPTLFLAWLCLLLLAMGSVPAQAQGQGRWLSGLVPSGPDGTPTQYPHWGSPQTPDYFPLDGTSTGFSSGDQSLPPPYNTPFYSYSWGKSFHDQPTSNFYIFDGARPTSASAGVGSIIEYPVWIAEGEDGWPYGPAVPLISSQQSAAALSLSISFVWKTQYQYNGDGDPPPVSSRPPSPTAPASIAFLVRTRLTATHTVSLLNAVIPLLPSLTASASVSDDLFGEQVVLAADSLSPSASGGGYHLVWVPMTLVNGNPVYTISLTGNVQAAANNTGVFPGQASATATLYAEAKQDTNNRAVGISCAAIEPSNYKGVYHNDNGSDGTDVYQHLRQLSNNSVDSVVGLVNDMAGQQHFIAGQNYASNAVNFMLPTFTWTITGDGTPDSDTVYNLNPNSANQFGLTTLPAILDFGGTWDPTTTKTTRFGVTVKDTDGSTANDTYTVTWHLPVENWNLINSVPTSNRIYPTLGSEPGGNTSIEPNRTIDYTIPTGEIDIAGPAVKTISVFLAGAGAAAPALMTESFAAGPYGIATVSLLAAGSVVAGFLVPPDPGFDTGHTNYGDYIFAVQQQQLINNGATGIQRFNPELVDLAIAQFNNLQNLYGDSWEDHWTEDHYFSQQNGAKMRVEAQVGRYCELDTYAGDAYDQNGYTGRTMNTLTRDKDVFYVETWTYNP